AVDLVGGENHHSPDRVSEATKRFVFLFWKALDDVPERLPRREGRNRAVAREVKLADFGAMMEISADAAVGQNERMTAWERFAPEKTMIPLQGRTVSVGILSAGVAPEIESGVNAHSRRSRRFPGISASQRRAADR